ncbi:MAG: hypothetical protein V1710_09480 [Candidatus Bathyarchaeota archaeon]
MNTPFTAEEHKEFLSIYDELHEKSLDLDYQIIIAQGEAPDKLVKELDVLREKLSDMRDQYRMNVPIMPLSRCPYTNQVVYHSIDHYGLDGLWWNNEVPIRPVEVLPSSFFMVNGAVKLGRVEKTSFLVKPGPEVPYVVSEILLNPQFKAVISRIRVGNHVAYPIFYFIEDWSKAMEPMNNWGANYWSFLDADMKLGYNEYDVLWAEKEPDYSDEPVSDEGSERLEYTFDFDLSKWIREGKLLWIAPDDSTLSLKTGTSGCPFLNLEGSQAFSVLFDGELTKPEEEM